VVVVHHVKREGELSGRGKCRENMSEGKMSRGEMSGSPTGCCFGARNSVVLWSATLSVGPSVPVGLGCPMYFE